MWIRLWRRAGRCGGEQGAVCARCAPAHGASPSLDSGLFLWLFSSGKLMDFPNLVLKGGENMHCYF